MNNDYLVDNDVTGIYRALVVNDKDPKRRGRIQIRIPALHGIPGDASYVPDVDLPWAQPATAQGLGVQRGQLIIPQPGMIVFVVFEADNIKDPLYLGTVSLVKNAYPIGSSPADSVATMPDVYDSEGNVMRDIIFCSDSGDSIYVDRSTGEIHVETTEVYLDRITDDEIYDLFY